MISFYDFKIRSVHAAAWRELKMAFTKRRWLVEQLARLKDRVATALILLLRSQCTDEETDRREPEDQRNLVRFPQIMPHAV